MIHTRVYSIIFIHKNADRYLMMRNPVIDRRYSKKEDNKSRRTAQKAEEIN